jgi:23S rRNA pseudouridine1911/1915/1917 synthase
VTHLVSDKSNIRLDIFLTETLGRSRSAVQQLVKQKCVSVNGETKGKSFLMSEGDVVVIKEPEPQEPVLVDHGFSLNILYEDNDIMLINKPSGLMVHPGENQKTICLSHLLQAYTDQLSTLSGEERSGIVHRLDQFTEGIMLIAKNNDAHEDLKEQFKNREIQKRYYAAVAGSPVWNHCEIDRAIGRHPSHRTKMAVVKGGAGDGKSAYTYAEVLKRFGTKTLLDVIPKTGRTHQIRVHLQDIGFPVIQDPVYGRGKGSGQLLQAYFLAFRHPTSGESVSVEMRKSKRLRC